MRKYAILALALLLAALAGCPGNKGDSTSGSSPAQSSNTTIAALTAKLKRPYPLELLQPEAFPAEAVAYLNDTLANMTSREYAPKDLVFYYMGMLPGSQVGRERVLKEVEISGEQQAPPLTMAYLAVDPENCLAYLRRQMLAGNFSVMMTIGLNAEVARWVMEHLDIPEDDQMINAMLMDAIDGWGLDVETYIPNLKAGLEGDDINARNVLQGYLIKLGEAGDDARRELEEKLKSDDMMTFNTAAEGMRKSDDPYFVHVLEPYVTEAENRTEPLPETELDKTEVVAYTLMTMEGEEARDLRLRLMKLGNIKTEWMAALGELLHGEPKYFNDLMRGSSPGDPNYWFGMQAPDLNDPALLPALDWMMGSDQVSDRFRVSDYLMRFRHEPASDLFMKILRKCLTDESDMVREKAWITAAWTHPELVESEAIAALTDPDEMPKVRIAATVCAMKPAILRANGELDAAE